MLLPAENSLSPPWNCVGLHSMAPFGLYAMGLEVPEMIEFSML